jgi:hypothetical protein
VLQEAQVTEVMQGQTWYVYSQKGCETYAIIDDPSTPFIWCRFVRPQCFLVIDTDWKAKGLDQQVHWVKVMWKNRYYLIEAQNFFGGPILEAEVFERFCPDELL